MIRLLRKKKIIFLLLYFILLLNFIINRYIINNSKFSQDNFVTIKNSSSKPLTKQKILEDLTFSQKTIKKIDNIKRLLVYQESAFGSPNSGAKKCRDDLEFEIIIDKSKSLEADLTFYHMYAPKINEKKKKNSYTIVFTMESEAHNPDVLQSWANADFRMWYNLDKSFPEPVTYFDMRVHLADLLSPPIVEFEKKTNDAPIVWIISNCNAFNGREKYIKNLMTLVKIDSYGACLNNKMTHTADRMKGNIELFTRYKFVIVIENSNCEDYVTEKLVHAVASGSIPIVAGKDNKPDYLKFIPRNSYINIYDFKSPKKLAEHLLYVSKNKALYESYLSFKRRHEYNRDYLNKLKLPELIQLANRIFNPNDIFLKEIVAKEKSENKICKIARYIVDNDPETIKKEIEKKKSKRPLTNEVCLPEGNLSTDFETKLNLTAQIGNMRNFFKKFF
jgi:hypothetical protein